MPIPELALADVDSADALFPLEITGRPSHPFVTIDLDRVDDRIGDSVLQRVVRALDRPRIPLVGRATRPLSPSASVVAQAADLTLVQGADESRLPASCVGVDDIQAGLQQLASATAVRTTTASVLCQTLRLTADLPVASGLVAESLAYSMLLAASEFREWRAQTPRRVRPTVEDPVRMVRDGAWLEVRLDHPARRNAYSREMRDGLVEALQMVAWDASITQVRLVGAGPVFCSGGDLDEFGTIEDVALAHLIRLRQGAGAALDHVRERVTAELHGPCFGAGVEIPAFAARVVAEPGTTFNLPEVAMGLIPGAGGTVSIPRRIGRWRTAWLGLSGQSVTADRALGWGLIDGLV